jgi:hypothetical protein
LCIWLVFYSLLSSLILSNLKHELLNRLRSTMAANVLTISEYHLLPTDICGHPDNNVSQPAAIMVSQSKFSFTSKLLNQVLLERGLGK